MRLLRCKSKPILAEQYSYIRLAIKKIIIIIIMKNEVDISLNFHVFISGYPTVVGVREEMPE